MDSISGASWLQRGEGMRAEYAPPEVTHDPINQDVHCLAQCPAGIFVGRGQDVRRDFWRRAPDLVGVRTARLIFGNSEWSRNVFYEKLNFSFIRDIAPVAGIMRVPSVMEGVQKGFGRPEQSSSRSTRNRRPSVPGSSWATW
jgi:hypothetical protein